MPRESKKNKTARAAAIFAELGTLFPDAHCSLNYSNPLELLVATILSAQCTDERVNIVTADLFVKYPSLDHYLTATQEEFEQDVRSTGFYRNKAKNILAATARIADVYGGEVPRTMDELITLGGVARKTANVVLGNAFGINEGFVVDTHVGRLSGRMKFTTETNPVKIERDMMAIRPQAQWSLDSHLLVFHGRGHCTARKPDCETCPLAKQALCPSAGKV